MTLTSRSKSEPEASPTPSASFNSPIVAEDEESGMGNNLPPASTAAVPIQRPASNPFITVLRKLCSSRNSHNEQDGTFLMNVFKDMIRGIILGVFFIYMILAVFRVGSARSIHEEAIELANSPQTIRFVEESMEMKFISFEVYNAMKNEIKRIHTQMEAKKAEITDNENKLEEYLSEKGPIEKEYEELTAEANVLYGLDKFCADCAWVGNTSCQGRVNFLMERYGNTLMQAKIAVVALPQCVKKWFA